MRPRGTRHAHDDAMASERADTPSPPEVRSKRLLAVLLAMAMFVLVVDGHGPGYRTLGTRGLVRDGGTARTWPDPQVAGPTT